MTDDVTANNDGDSDPDDEISTDQLAVLSGELAEVTAVIETLGGELLGQRQLITTTVQRFQALHEDQDQIGKQLAKILAALSDPKRPAVFRWELLAADKPAEALDRWANFVAWVHDMHTWYRYPEIPGCPKWWTHRGLVEELTALWIEWRAAWSPRAPSAAARFFHEALNHARPRCSQIAQSCTAGEHIDGVDTVDLTPSPDFADVAVGWPLARTAPYTDTYRHSASDASDASDGSDATSDEEEDYLGAAPPEDYPPDDEPPFGIDPTNVDC